MRFKDIERVGKIIFVTVLVIGMLVYFLGRVLKSPLVVGTGLTILIIVFFGVTMYTFEPVTNEDLEKIK